MKLNEQQQAVVDSCADKIVCLAGAGAGKSTTMIARIAKLVESGVSPSSILALTFTNAAGFEMREKYKSMNPGKQIPEFRTFHSFCYSLIMKDLYVREAVGYTNIPSVIDEDQMKPIRKYCALKVGTKLSDKKLCGPPLTNRQQEFERQTFQTQLRRELNNRNVITFDILCYDTSKLFVDDYECIQKYKEQYKYVFVDEGQDSDPKQIDFFLAFTNSKLCIVGDILQNLYSFRGCTNESLKQFAKDPNWTVYRLDNNYRSTNQICDYANEFAKDYSADEYRIEMVGQRDSSEPVHELSASWAPWQSPIAPEDIAQALHKIEGISGEGDSAILCRTNREVNCVIDILTDKGIKFSTGKKDVVAENVLKSAMNDEYFENWLATFLSAENYAEYIRLKTLCDNPDIKWFSNNFRHIPQISIMGKLVCDCRRILMNNQLTISQMCSYIIQLLNLDITLSEYPIDSKNIYTAILDKLAEAKDNDLYVGTIHSSKGLEYNTVFVMGVNSKLFPLGSEEMNNLFYVACTRAKNHLFVYFNR